MTKKKSKKKTLAIAVIAGIVTLTILTMPSSGQPQTTMPGCVKP